MQNFPCKGVAFPLFLINVVIYYSRVFYIVFNMFNSIILALKVIKLYGLKKKMYSKVNLRVGEHGRHSKIKINIIF